MSMFRGFFLRVLGSGVFESIRGFLICVNPIERGFLLSSSLNSH